MRRPAWQLTAMGLLFLGPFVVAMVIYAGRGVFGGIDPLPNPDRELIEPPPTIPLEPIRLAGGGQSDPDWARSRWSLVYARMRPCETECTEALSRLHQVWLALGAERDRVREVFLAPAGEASPGGEASPAGGASTVVPDGFLSGVIDASGGPDLLRLLGPERLARGQFFVVDPLGNVILSYPDDADQTRLLRDLERLLDVSRVG